jgi:hypothetical protein
MQNDRVSIVVQSMVQQPVFGTCLQGTIKSECSCSNLGYGNVDIMYVPSVLWYWKTNNEAGRLLNPTVIEDDLLVLAAGERRMNQQARKTSQFRRLFFCLVIVLRAGRGARCENQREAGQKKMTTRKTMT